MYQVNPTGENKVKDATYSFNTNGATLGAMDVAHVAKLANLRLNPGEEEKFKNQFEETLKTVDLIKELDISGIEPTSQVTGLINPARDDDIDRSRILPPPKNDNGYFVVPAIFNVE